MKEQNKNPDKEINKVEISNLSDAEFKTMFIRMLKDLIRYFNSIKMIQTEMKVKLHEIKKTLQRINNGVNEAKNQITDLKHKKEKDIQSEQQEETRLKKQG